MQKWCLLLTGVSTESQKRTSLLRTKRTVSMTRIISFYFPHGQHNICTFEDMVYQQIVGIPIGRNYAPLIADLFLFCYERDFMSNIHKSFRVGLIFAEFATSGKLPKIHSAKNKLYYTSSLRVLEIAKIGLNENLTHLLSVIFAKMSRRETFPIYGIHV